MSRAEAAGGAQVPSDLPPSTMDDAPREVGYSDAQRARDEAAMPKAFNDDFGGGTDSPSVLSSCRASASPSAGCPKSDPPGTGASTCPTPSMTRTTSSTDALLRLKPDLLVDPFRKRSTALGYTRSHRWATWRQWDYVHLHEALAACPHPSDPMPFPTMRLANHDTADGYDTAQNPKLVEGEVTPSSAGEERERKLQDRWDEPDDPAENSIAEKLRSIMDARIDHTPRESGPAERGSNNGRGELRVAADGWVDWDLSAMAAQQVTEGREGHRWCEEEGTCENAVSDRTDGDANRIVEVTPPCVCSPSGMAPEEEEWNAEAALLEFDDALLPHHSTSFDSSRPPSHSMAGVERANGPQEQLVAAPSDLGSLNSFIDSDQNESVDTSEERWNLGLPTVIPPRQQALEPSGNLKVVIRPDTRRRQMPEVDEFSAKAIFRKAVDDIGQAEAWTVSARAGGDPPSPDSEHSQFAYFFPAPSEGDASPSPRDLHQIRQFEADFPALSGAPRRQGSVELPVAAAAASTTWASRLAGLAETPRPVQPGLSTRATRTGWDGFDIDECDAGVNAERLARREHWQFSDLPTPTLHTRHLAPVNQSLHLSPDAARIRRTTCSPDHPISAAQHLQPGPAPPVGLPSPASLIRTHADTIHRHSTLFVEQANNPWLLTQPDFIARVQALSSPARRPSGHLLHGTGRHADCARQSKSSVADLCKKLHVAGETDPVDGEAAEYGDEQPPAYSPPRQADVFNNGRVRSDADDGQHALLTEEPAAAPLDVWRPHGAVEEIACATCGMSFANRQAYESHAREDLSHSFRADTGQSKHPGISTAIHPVPPAVHDTLRAALPYPASEPAEDAAAAHGDVRQAASCHIEERSVSPGPPRLERSASPRQRVPASRPKPKPLDPYTSYCTRCQRHFGSHYRLLMHCQDSIAHPYYCRGCTVDFRTFADLHMHYAAEALCRPPQMAYGLGKGFLQILVEHQGDPPLDFDATTSLAKTERPMQRKTAAGVTRRWWHPLPITPERVPTPVPLLPAGHAQASPDTRPPSSSDIGAAPEPDWVGDSLAASNQASMREGFAVDAQALVPSQSSSLLRPRPILDVERGRHETPCCPICISPLMDASEVLATACGHVYCTRCLLLHFRQTGHLCPKCRTPLTMTMLAPLYMHGEA